MAEVLGLVASGISVAQVAGSIVTSSLKLKVLLDDIKDAPDNLRDMLDHLELLAPILCEATTAGDDTAGTSPPRLSAPANAHLQQALQRALAACQTASEQLQQLLTDLMSKINGNRGGVRRKSAMVKVVLKKSTLAQYEMRLQKTIQLLTLAQNTYIFALQRTQPEAIISQLMSALAENPQPLHARAKPPHEHTSTKFEAAPTASDCRASAKRNPSSFEQYWQLGFAKVTGLVRIHTPSKSENSETIASSHAHLLRIQIHMPTWLCTSVFDTVFSRSYSGWACSLNVYGNILYDSEEYNMAETALGFDDVDMIYHLFQCRKCSPLDHLVHANGLESSLLEHAMRLSAWQIAAYLLDYDSEQVNTSHHRAPRTISVERQPYFETFLQRNELSDTIRIDFLALCCRDLNSFTDLIRRVWPEKEFYDAALEGQRRSSALNLVRHIRGTASSPSPDIFHHLCTSLNMVEAEYSAVGEIIYSMAFGLGFLLWQDPDAATKWRSVFFDTILRPNKSLVMIAASQYCMQYDDSPPFAQLFRTGTSFTNLFIASLMALPGGNSEPKRARQHKITGRLANCERAVRMWLGMLKDCDIDLLEYGKQTKRTLYEQGGDYDFRIFRDVWFDRVGVKTYNGFFEVRLISFQYGSQPEDWKLWWSEPTDELVGDFWTEMEPETLWIPGSWDEG